MSAQQRTPHALIALAALLGALSACAKIVGIEDTTITRTDGSGGDQSSSGGPGAAGEAFAGTSNAGHSNAGTSNAGQSNGGSAPSGGAATAGDEAGGASDGTAGSGGLVNQAGSAGNAGASECPCSAPKPTCENGKCVVRGPTMAKATSFYIDSTEVSKSEYDVFLAAKGTDTSGQISACSWNTSYAPTGDAVDDPRPIVNVDWCDAAAFCAWADKRLCGAVGGGPIASPDDLLDSTKSQMYLACGGADGERYPYGGATYLAGYCNVTGGYMADVGKFNQCEGHYMGIFDLVGNAAEWIDYCDTGGGTDRSMDNCEVGGGSYLNEQFKCQSYDSFPRNTHGDAVGFRCCSK